MNRTANKYLSTATVALATFWYSGGTFAGGLLDVEFDDVMFSAPMTVDNPYWPLNPDGATRIFTYEGETEDGCEVNKLFVNGGPPGGPTTGVKVLTGDYAFLGQVLEVLDIAWVDEECDGSLVEAEVTFDWYVQDTYGNIWYMGEASRDFGDVDLDGVEVACPSMDAVPIGTPADSWPGPDGLYEECTAGSWESGIVGGEGDEAVVGEPGIVVPSDMPYGPSGEALENGTYYLQEVAFEAQDMAKVLKVATSVDDYDECRKVKEWSPFEHGGSIEHKWYCRDGRGLELIEGIGGGVTTVEELVSVETP